MKKIILFLFLVGLALKIHAQERTVKNIITISPLTLLERETALQIGFQHKFNKTYGWQTDVSYIFIDQFTGGSELFSSSPVKGFAIKSEVKKFFPKKDESKWSAYLAAQIMAKRVDYFSFEENGNYPEKYVGGLNFKYGMEMFAHNGFFFDWYAGLGIRVRSISNNSLNDIYSNGVLPTICLGFRIGKGF